MADVCVPVVARSAEASSAIADRVALLVVDGGHRYREVRADLVRYGPKVLPGGFIFMDDYASRRRGVPVLDTWEELEVVVALLRLQTARPFIVVIDTGSHPRQLRRITQLRAEDVEVHSLRFGGVRHPADLPAIAMDLAFSLCRTPLLFATHADRFLRRRDFLEELVGLGRTHGVAGYEITPRDAPSVERPNWPDTEVLLNLILRQHGIRPHLIGREENFRRNLDENIDHVRTLTTAMLYLPSYYRQARAWADAAMAEARERIAQWSGSAVRARRGPDAAGRTSRRQPARRVQ